MKSEERRECSLSLEDENWIVEKIREVELGSLFLDLWVLADQEPSHVSEEKSTGSVVRVSIGVGPLVMATVITSPLDHVILQKNQVIFEKSGIGLPGEQCCSRASRRFSSGLWLCRTCETIDDELRR